MPPAMRAYVQRSSTTFDNWLLVVLLLYFSRQTGNRSAERSSVCCCVLNYTRLAVHSVVTNYFMYTSQLRHTITQHEC
jgi:hypothetical protein